MKLMGFGQNYSTLRVVVTIKCFLNVSLHGSYLPQNYPLSCITPSQFQIAQKIDIASIRLST